jgi:catechol 2,3-dioxygenase-like lactoylglutathione lyase family enzyme
MFGAETLDHVGIPVRDLDRSEKFYQETLGLSFLTRRKNADGSPRHTYVLAGENIIGLNLPGVQVPASTTGAPRYAIAVDSEDRFEATVKKIRECGVRYGVIEEVDAGSPFIRSFCFDDPEDNHLEICFRREGLTVTFLSHVVFETADLACSTRFYTEALGLEPLGEVRSEQLFRFKNHQLLGLKKVAALSDRTKKHGRAVHVAFNVTQEDFDRMGALITEMKGRSLGDHRSEDGLRPPGERSLYFFDPDTNYLQITAHGEENWDMLSDEEKWRRIIENRKKQGKGISSFDAGKKPGV